MKLGDLEKEALEALEDLKKSDNYADKLQKTLILFNREIAFLHARIDNLIDWIERIEED